MKVAVCLILLLSHVAAPQKSSDPARLMPKQIKDKWGYVNNKGKIVIPPQFDTALPFNDGFAQVGMLDKESSNNKNARGYKWGFIDERGRIIVELQYAALRDFSEGLAAIAVPSKEKEGLSYRDTVIHNLRWGYVDRSGRIVIAIKFLSAGDFSENLAAVDVGEASKSMCARPSKFGYIDKTGAFVIEPAFAGAGPFHKGRARVSKGRTCYVGRCLCCAPRFFGSYGHIDKKGVFTDETPADSNRAESAPCHDN